jgi:hypothetical protein
MAEVQRPIVPARLFRFRSLTRSANAVQEEIDPIRKKYLYCSEFTRMNDPMEGFFRASKMLSGKSDYEDIVEEITKRKTNLGMACFTETHEDVLMWTHYAGNYTGMCLSYSTFELLDGLSNDVKLIRLTYVDEPPMIYPSQVKNTGNAAIQILSQKKYNWAYEREWRVMGPVGNTSIGRVQAVKAVYFGSRVDLGHRNRFSTKSKVSGLRPI